MAKESAKTVGVFFLGCGYIFRLVQTQPKGCPAFVDTFRPKSRGQQLRLFHVKFMGRHS